MTFKSAPYFWLVCDGCERSSTEGGDNSAWINEAQAITDAEYDGWFVEPGRHLCWKCAQKMVCPECGDAKPADAATCTDCGGVGLTEDQVRWLGMPGRLLDDRAWG